MVSFVKGVTYNLRGIKLAFKTPRLLLLGLIRFAVVIMLTTLAAGLVLYHHQDILNLIWIRPESVWLVWLWHAVSWLVSLLLAGVCVILSYLASQLLFAVIVMDAMSRITEQLVVGRPREQAQAALIQQFIFLVRQEIPRTTIPVLITLMLMVSGWLTPLGPLLTVLASATAVIFLAWDNTDLVPARRLEPFSDRIKFLLKTLPFHLGFGVLFLVPGLNILLLSFAPVGATLYYIENHDH
jgi:CysZ protein